MASPLVQRQSVVMEPIALVNIAKAPIHIMEESLAGFDFSFRQLHEPCQSLPMPRMRGSTTPNFICIPLQGTRADPGITRSLGERDLVASHLRDHGENTVPGLLELFRPCKILGFGTRRGLLRIIDVVRLDLYFTVTKVTDIDLYWRERRNCLVPPATSLGADVSELRR